MGIVLLCVSLFALYAIQSRGIPPPSVYDLILTHDDIPAEET